MTPPARGLPLVLRPKRSAADSSCPPPTSRSRSSKLPVLSPVSLASDRVSLTAAFSDGPRFVAGKEGGVKPPGGGFPLAGGAVPPDGPFPPPGGVDGGALKYRIAPTTRS